MNEFDKASQGLMVLAGVSAEMGAEEHEERSDAFAAAVQDVGGDCIDEIDAGVEILPDLFLDPSSSSRYTSQTSAMLWSVRVVGPFDMGRIVGQETPPSQALVGGFVLQFASPFS